MSRGEEPRLITGDDQGQAIREATPDGTILEERAYDEDGYLIAEVNGAGEGEQYWYDARGNRTRVVDATGNVTAVEYDDGDLPLREIAPDGLVTTYVHDDKGALTGITYPSGLSYSFTYDARGRLTGVVSAEGRLWAFEYDGRHDVVAERVAYDRLGRPITVCYADGTSSSTAYDPMGKPVRVTDRLGRTTTMEYAGMGVLARLVQPDGHAWRFKYTSKERLAEITNPRGEPYKFAYDAGGRVIEERTFDGRVLAYRYAPSGRLSHVGYPDKSWRAFTYDRAGRLTGEQASDTSVIAYHRDQFGRLIGAVLQDGGQQVVTQFERDALGRVVVERQGDRAIRYAYDTHGRRVGRVMPDGAATRYAYDALNALIEVEHDGHKVVLERDAVGRETQRLTAGGRIAIQSGYDALDRLIEQRATAPSPGEGVPSVLVQRQWQYDRAGRVTRLDDARWGTTTYAYDKIDQLMAARRGAHQELFEYDPAGSLFNMLDGLGAGASAQGSWEVKPGNLLVRTEKAKYGYDKRARRVSKIEFANAGNAGQAGQEKVTEYVWDVRDRLREAKLPGGTRVVMSYDAFGRRVRKEVLPSDGARRPRVVEFVWDRDALAADIDTESGARGFVHEPGTFVPLLQQERGEVFTYVNDHLGMPKELIDPAGMVAWSAAHSAWGMVIETYSDARSELNRGRKVSSPFRLLGEVVDEETGLCWTRFRCFDPDVGRWCSPDPLGIAGGRDLFGFSGSPTGRIDPLGLSDQGGNPHEHSDVTVYHAPKPANAAQVSQGHYDPAQYPGGVYATTDPRQAGEYTQAYGGGVWLR